MECWTSWILRVFILLLVNRRFDYWFLLGSYSRRISAEFRLCSRRMAGDSGVLDGVYCYDCLGHCIARRFVRFTLWELG